MGFNLCTCHNRTCITNTALSPSSMHISVIPWFSLIWKLLDVTLLVIVISPCVTSASFSTDRNTQDNKYLPPTITVMHGDRVYEKPTVTFQVEDHDNVYFSCKAPYPIQWALGHETNQSAIGRVFSSHLSISRSFSDFYDKSSYLFIITSRIRFRSNNGTKSFRFSCQAIDSPEELCLLLVLTVDKNSGVISLSNASDSGSSENYEDELCAKTSFVNHKTRDLSLDSECQSYIYYKRHLNPDADESDENHLVLHAHGPKYSFTCKFPNGKPGFVKTLAYCPNAMVCNNLYRKTRLPRKCVKAIHSKPENSSEECDSCQEKVTRLFSGFIGCAPSEHDKKPESQLFIFSSVPQEDSNDTTIHFSMATSSDADDEMISLSKVPATNYIGEQLFVTCNVSNYYFAGGTRLALKHKDQHELSFLKSVHMGIHDPVHNNGFGVEEAAIPIMSDSLERVYCFAPVWNSFSWVNKSRKINIEDDTKILKAVAFTFSVAVVIFASFFAIFWVLIVNRKNAIKLLSTQEIQGFYKGNIIKYENACSSYEEVYSQAAYDSSCEIQRERLLLDETAVLGRGHFGLVIKGVLKDEKLGTNNVEVAVKTIKTKMDVACLKALLSELKIMASIGKHPNVVNLMGACTKKMAKGEVFVAVEFCNNGNLQNFLRKHRGNFHNQVIRDIIVIEMEGPPQVGTLACPQEPKEITETITTLDLVKWSWEIARGMEFLSSKKVIHGDVATRNILLTIDKIAKVSDFGLSRQLVDYYYVKKETGPMPWKWMAIESLRDMKFSVQSDVWSYGITLWEIFTLADTPYTGCSWSAEFVITLLSGHRLGRPPFATSEIYDLMRECWNNEPSERPSFFTTKLFFEDILAQTSNQDYMQIECSHGMSLEHSFQKVPLLRITEALSPEEDEVFE